MHSSLYEEVGSKYGLERGDSIEGRQVQHLHKRDYIRSVVQQAKQAEKAVKSLQTMIRRLEALISHKQKMLEQVEEELTSGRIALQDYEAQKSDIQHQLAEYQTKLDDKAAKLNLKERELERLTKDVERAGAVVQPFRNHKIDFEPPRITEKPPMFGADEWLDEQNGHFADRFVKTIRQIEALYRKDAEQQVQAAQQNALVDYKELGRLQQENERLTDFNENLSAMIRDFFDQMAEPSIREQVFAIADALIGGQPVAPSSGGGGSSSDSDMRWDGRNPDEEEDEYRRRCLLHAAKVIHKAQRKSMKR